MSVASRPVSTGKTRTCPHCKATILESLSICPGCMHHLRFDSEAAKRQVAAAPALRVEGIIRHPPLEQPLEYFVIIAVRNDRGEEVTRQVVNVGALQAAEKRTFTLSVEVLPPQAPVPSKSNAATGTFKSPIPQPAATVRPPTPPPSPTSAPSAGQPAGGSTAGGSAGSGSSTGGSTLGAGSTSAATSAAGGGTSGASAGTAGSARPGGPSTPPAQGAQSSQGTQSPQGTQSSQGNQSPQGTQSPQGIQSSQGTQSSPGAVPNPGSGPGAPGSNTSRPNMPRPGTNMSRPPGGTLARPPGASTAKPPGTSGNPGATNPAAGPGNPTNPANPAGSNNPAGPASPASPAKPTSGYVLKPPSPGGPKRH